MFKSPQQQHDFNFPFQLSSGEGMSDPPEASSTFSVPVVENDIIVTGTDGLFDNIFTDEIARVAVLVSEEAPVPPKQPHPPPNTHARSQSHGHARAHTHTHTHTHCPPLCSSSPCLPRPSQSPGFLSSLPAKSAVELKLRGEGRGMRLLPLPGWCPVAFSLHLPPLPQPPPHTAHSLAQGD